MGWLYDTVILGDGLRILLEATLYNLGVLTLCVHMAWRSGVVGRLKGNYSHSKNVVYNTFAWPELERSILSV